MPKNFAWYRIGNGAKIHAIKDGGFYTACRIGGPLIGPFNPLTHERCKTCEKKLGMNK